METTGEWLECVVDGDYEIYSEYPYSIRRKGSDRIIKESIGHNGYLYCYLNRIQYRKHRIIAQQFIDNDDPENKTQIDHLNHNKTDNRIQNLRWVNHSENMKNRTSMNGHQYVFLDELPETSEPLDDYNEHEFDGLWIDYENRKLYSIAGHSYRELLPIPHGRRMRYMVKDINKRPCFLIHETLFE